MDLIEGIVRIAGSKEHLPMNIDNPHEFTILECVHTALKVTDSKSELQFAPLPEDDPTRRHPDITKAQTLLDWEPKVTLEKGLNLSFDSFIEKVSVGVENC